MTLALACTWVPRGEGSRLERIRPLLLEAYTAIVIAIPPNRDLSEAELLRAWPATTVKVSPEPFGARFLAIETSAALPVSHVHYADLDMLIRWIENRPDEWRRVLDQIQSGHCLITGRTARAFQTRPLAIQQTEQVINEVGSHLLRQTVDLGLGSRGYSRAAARVILANSCPGGYGDLEWPVLVQRAGLPIRYLEVDGVDWETPDQFRGEPADPETQREVADRYDQRADRWALRVRTAHEIIHEGIAALGRPLVEYDGA